MRNHLPDPAPQLAAALHHRFPASTRRAVPRHPRSRWPRCQGSPCPLLELELIPGDLVMPRRCGSVAVAAPGSDLARGPGAARGRWQQSPRGGPGLVPQPFLPSLQLLCRLRAGTSGVNALRKHKADPRHISAAIFSAPLLTNKLLLAGDGEASAAAGAPRRAPAPCRASWPAPLSPGHGARRMLNPPHPSPAPQIAPGSPRSSSSIPATRSGERAS